MNPIDRQKQASAAAAVAAAARPHASSNHQNLRGGGGGGGGAVLAATVPQLSVLGGSLNSLGGGALSASTGPADFKDLKEMAGESKRGGKTRERRRNGAARRGSKSQRDDGGGALFRLSFFFSHQLSPSFLLPNHSNQTRCLKSPRSARMRPRET